MQAVEFVPCKCPLQRPAGPVAQHGSVSAAPARRSPTAAVKRRMGLDEAGARQREARSPPLSACSSLGARASTAEAAHGSSTPVDSPVRVGRRSARVSTATTTAAASPAPANTASRSRCRGAAAWLGKTSERTSASCDDGIFGLSQKSQRALATSVWLPALIIEKPHLLSVMHHIRFDFGARMSQALKRTPS
ncbi:hypothetical protein T492DRAFT_1097344 [Pavlovales sp. CCMP2436]|nr:hypothetical protein T492DRAFT_1097344 [Pavlovales sp. CCMP2436]